MNEKTEIQVVSWPFFCAGALGALLLDLTRWVFRLQTNSLPENLAYELIASVLLVLVGGCTAGIFAGVIRTAWQAAMLGAGAPGVLRAMARLAPLLIETYLKNSQP